MAVVRMPGVWWWRWGDVCQGVRRLSIIIHHRRKAPACLDLQSGQPRTDWVRSLKSFVLQAGHTSVSQLSALRSQVWKKKTQCLLELASSETNREWSEWKYFALNCFMSRLPGRLKVYDECEVEEHLIRLFIANLGDNWMFLQGGDLGGNYLIMSQLQTI